MWDVPPGQSEQERPITPKQAADLLGCSTSAVVAWADQGKLRSFRTPGGHRRFLRSEVESLRAELDMPAAVNL